MTSSLIGAACVAVTLALALAQTAASTTHPMVASFYNTGPASHQPNPARTFCFVIGAEGTGSTWMSRMLPADYRPPANPHRGRGTVTGLVHDLWSSGPVNRVRRAAGHLITTLTKVVPTKAQFVVLHASSPDWDSDHYPDLHSSLWPAFHRAGFRLKVLVMTRDPAEAAHSNHRRRWKHLRVGGAQDVVKSARSTEKHMTLLAGQVRALPFPDDVLVVDYWSVMNDPVGESERITRYLGVPDRDLVLDLNRGPVLSRHRHRLSDRIRKSRRSPSNYTRTLTKPESEFLDAFFDAERVSKWAYLIKRSRAPVAL